MALYACMDLEYLKGNKIDTSDFSFVSLFTDVPALKGNRAAFGNILSLGTLDGCPEIVLGPGGVHDVVLHHGDVGGVLQGHLGVLHHQVHAVADLGQGVDAALVPAAVPQPSLVNYQCPVIRVYLGSETTCCKTI